MRRSVRHALTSLFAIAAITFMPFAAEARLERGDSGDEVKKLQQILKDKGHYTGTMDGKFGRSTEAAVEDFQKKNGLKADGVVGGQTWDKLVPSGAGAEKTLRSGAKGDAVKRLQTLLKEKGADIKADGKFGKTTVAAVKAFQKKSGLTADGVVGKTTWEKLKA